MTERAHFRGRDLNNPAEYPGRYETDWLRRRHRRVTARAVLAILTFAAFFVPLTWRGALAAAILAGGLHLVYFWRRHHAATAWHKDAYAERRSVHVLLPLESQGYLVLHDHFHQGFCIQTLLIGPPGVWLVHAVGRAPLRRLWGDAAFLRPEKQPVPPEPAALADRARAVGATLTAEAGEPVTVRPLYLAVGDDVPASVRKGGLVPLVAKGLFRSYLAGEPARLEPADIDRLAVLAGTALPPRRPDRGRPSLPPMAVKKAMWPHKRGYELIRETDIARPRHRRDS